MISATFELDSSVFWIDRDVKQPNFLKKARTSFIIWLGAIYSILAFIGVICHQLCPSPGDIHWCAKIKDEVEKLAYQLNEEAERTERPIRILSRIIGKLEEGRSVTSVAAEFGIAHSIVSRLWRQFQTTGTAILGFSSGCPRGTTPADDRYIVLHARRNRRQTAGEFARHTTQVTGRPISRFTVARRLHGGGLFARHPVRCVPLTPAHRRRRSLWCREHRNWRNNEWGRVLFTDESRFSLSSDSHRILIWREWGSRNHTGHPSQGCFGLQSHCAPCYFFNQASFYPSDFSFSYQHLRVNHSLTFKDPETSAHTNSIEGTWSAIKRSLRNHAAHVEGEFDHYLAEYMWRRRRGHLLDDDVFREFLRAITALYPPMEKDVPSISESPVYFKERPASDPKCVVIHSSEDQFASFKIFVVIHSVFSSVVIEELAEELGLIVEASLTKPKLKDLVKSPDYIEDDIKVMIDSIVKDRIRTEEEKLRREQREYEEKLRREQREYEEKLRREEREYELEKLRIQAEKNANTMNNPENVQAPKVIHETFHKFNMKDDISLNLTLFERHVELTFLPKKDWVQKLIGLIPIDIAHLIAREPADKCNDYNHVKGLLLKRFKLSPEKLRQLFISHRKSNERTWQAFFYEIQTYFDGWISGSNVETFDQLRELIIADQIKKSAPYELREHFLDEWSTINSPAEIAEKFEEYESVRRTLRPKCYNSFAKGRYEASGSSDTYFQRTEYPQGGSNRRERKHFQLNGTSYSGKSKRLTCSYCKGPKHYAVDCTKRPKCSKINNSTDSSIQICSRISRERIKTRKITMGNKIIEALVDSGSSVSLIREDVSKGIIEPSKLSKDISVLIGLGKYEVKTKGSFQRKIELDGEEYFVTWHVVPTPSLEFQAVIGSDILEQASVCFYKESVQFRKHEDKNCFLQMQVYEAEVEDEIVVQHVTNPKIRRELFELISNYEPKKTEMTNVSMRIILKDDIPVYQPARRLSFSENQDVNKQIDEWLEQEIIRPSSHPNMRVQLY
ncbi:transposon Tf2-9 polyprotein [Trichonephila clavipes]|nr:transposon Tf2-9 polyprotein [Trichonephila clavipes]